MKKSYHFSRGNSTSGPVGYCARVEAENAQDAIAKLKTVLEELDYTSGELWSSGDQYLQVYFGDDPISEEDIDEINHGSYIRDDNGMLWYFDEDEGRIKCVGDDTEGGGYLCIDFEHGVWVLNQYGYITGPEED